jgi:hypothetical protein
VQGLKRRTLFECCLESEHRQTWSI